MAEAGAAAAEAYESFAAFLTELAGKATGDWALGEQRYSALLQEKELLDRRRRLAARARAGRNTRRSTTRCARCAVTRGATTTGAPASTRSTRTGRRRPTRCATGYERWTETARAFLHEHELVSFPDGEECSVEPSPPFQRPVLAVASVLPTSRHAAEPEGTFQRPVPARRNIRQGPRRATGRQQLRQHGDDERARGVPGPSLALRVAAGRCAADPPSGHDAVLRRGLGALYGADDAGAGLLHRSVPGPVPSRRPHLPRGSHRRRHEPALRRHDVRRGRRLHAHELAAHRGRGPRRGHALLRLADAGGFVPHRLARDRALARALARARATACATSTTASPARVACPSRWPSARCSDDAAATCGARRCACCVVVVAACASDGRTLREPAPGATRRRCRGRRRRVRARSPVLRPVPQHDRIRVDQPRIRGRARRSP